MEKVESQQSEDNNQSVDAFTTVMGPEHPGCMRLYGQGVTKITLKRKEQYESYLSANDEKIQKQMEELEERMHQRMAEKLEQKASIHQEVTNDILGRLSHMYPGLKLSADTLTELGVQSPQEAVQPFNRPSSSINNQGLDIPAITNLLLSWVFRCFLSSSSSFRCFKCSFCTASSGFLPWSGSTYFASITDTLLLSILICSTNSFMIDTEVVSVSISV